MMKLLCKSTLLIILVVFNNLDLKAASASEVDNTNPYILVENLATNMFDRMKMNRKRITEDPGYLGVIMEEELIPHIDYEFASFIVLGKHFKSVPNNKLKKYTLVFRHHLIATYSNAMSYYTNQRVIFEPASDYVGKKSVTVKAVVTSPGEPDLNIAFKVRKDNRDNSWKVYDMVAEGISLLGSKRNEFQTILRKEGIDAVISLMEK